MTDSHPDSSLNPAWETEDTGQSFPLLDYLQLLWFRRKLIVAITIFVVVVGYIQVNEIKNVYTASSTLMTSLPQARVVDIETVLSGDGYGDKNLRQLEILRSRSLVGKVIDRLNLLNYAEFNPSLREPAKSAFDFLKHLNPRRWIPASWKKVIKEAIGYETQRAPPPSSQQEQDDEKQHRMMSTATNIFLGKMSVQQYEWSSVMYIRFTSLDPKLAARVANEIPEAYIVDKLEARFEATEKANAWLIVQLEELETKVVESERAVQIYREEYSLAETPGTSMLDEQLSELNSRLIIARAERAEVVARLEQLRRLLAGGGQGVESVEYGPKHPRMLQVQAEIIEIRERIRDEVGRIVIGLENEADFARTRVASLQGDLREAQGQTNEQNKESIQLRALQREAAANRALYETFLNRFKETSTTQGMETRRC